MNSASIASEASRKKQRFGLLRILGMGFGVAVIFGGTIGVGILRLPGSVAAQLGDYRLILLVWVLGGLYALLGSISVTELATMLPQAGGFYVYAKRAFGGFGGFAVGWADWLTNCASLAYASFAAADYLAALWPDSVLRGNERWTAICILAFFAALQWTGVRSASGVQKLTSSATALAFLFLVAACFLHHGSGDFAPSASAARLPVGLPGIIAGLVVATRSVLVTYDGWYGAIYFTEEDVDPAHNLPRTMIGGVLIVITMYLLVNVALLHTLSIPQLAASNLPAADAAQIIFGKSSGRFIILLSLLTLLSLINSILLGATRIIFGISRDGFFTKGATSVSAGGTPRVALAITAIAPMLLVATGTFERTIAIAAVFFVANYAATYVALILLRRKKPQLPRPFRAWGYPWTTMIVLIGSLLFLGGAVFSDTRNSFYALGILAVSVPAYLLMTKRSRTVT